jgi:cytoskeletal protein CcmA (bactofilin family)
MKDLNADGIVTCGGGTYDTVDLDGVITITDSVVCDSFELDGVGKIKGDIQAGSIRIAGTCRVEGGLKAEKIDVHGLLNLTGDLEGDQVEIDGALDVTGEINADTFSLLMSHGSAAREVLGQSCSVKKGKGSVWVSILKARKHEFTCQNIECDDIYLENCTVQRVNGQRVVIGPKCKIASLEYAESHSVHESAIVETISKRGEQV